MTEIELIKKERDILFNCLKTIARSNNTPAYIRLLCNNAAKEAKKLKEENLSINALSIDNSPLKINDIVKSIKNKICTYKIIKFGPIIENIQLVDLSIVKIDNKDQSGIGSISYNVPITFLQRI